VILTTGPAHGGVVAGSPFLSSLADAGLIRPDALHLGLDVTQGCPAVGGNDGRRPAFWPQGRWRAAMSAN